MSSSPDRESLLAGIYRRGDGLRRRRRVLVGAAAGGLILVVVAVALAVDRPTQRIDVVADPSSTTVTTLDATSTSESATTTEPTTTSTSLVESTTTSGGTTPTSEAVTESPAPGPSVSGGAGDRAALQAAVDDARERWESTRPSNGYGYRYETRCFCYPNGPVDVEVDGAGDVVAVAPPGSTSFTVDDLFGRIQDAINRADSVTASFDVNRGYPVEWNADYSTAMADEEFGTLVSTFIAR